jgi:hypothetical protein
MRLLIDEQEGKKELDKIKKMDDGAKFNLGLSYYETTAMVNELMNLEYTMNGTLFKVEPASKSIRRDRVSSLIYSNWYVRLLGEENKRNREEDNNDLYMFSAGF